MYRRFRFISLSVAMLSVLTACVHEFPDLSTPAEIVLNIRFDSEFDGQTDVTIHKDRKPEVHELDQTVHPVMPDSRKHDLRGVVRLYRQLSGGGYDFSHPDYESVVSDDDSGASGLSVRMSVAEGSYMAGLWLDMVAEGSLDDLHYRTGDMRAVSHSEPYSGSTDSRDAFTGAVPLDVVRYGRGDIRNTYDVTVSRPFAKFVLIADDLEEFITKTLFMRAPEQRQTVDLSEFEVRIRYMSDGLDDNFGLSKPVLYDLPAVYDVLKGIPTGTVPGVEFRSSLERIDGGKARLGFDYVYPSNGHTYVVVSVYDGNGVQVAQTPSVQIPLTRNRVTEVSGSFLMQNVSGGTVVDPEFSGDHDYEVK